MNRITTEVTSEDDNAVKMEMSLINDQDDIKIAIIDKDYVAGPQMSAMGNFSVSNVESIIQFLQMFLTMIKKNKIPTGPINRVIGD